MENAGDLDRPVASRAKQIERRHAGERADFMVNGSAAAAKERFDRVKRGGRNCFKQSQAECLGDRRLDAIENYVRSSAFEPLRTGGRRNPLAGFGELEAGIAFGAFEALR